MDRRSLLTFLRRITVPGPRAPLVLLLASLQQFWFQRLTRSGRYLVGGSVMTLFAGAFPHMLVGSVVFSGVIALLLVSMAATLRPLPRISIERSLPQRLHAGARVTMQIHVTNTSSRTILDAAATEFGMPPSFQMMQNVQYVAHLQPGESKNFDHELVVGKRGLYQLAGPSLVSAFPFGLAQSRKFYPQPQRVVVCPQFHPLTRMNLPASRRYQPGGMAMTSNIGESMEFVGTRDYRPGDRIRDLHIRSWARVGYPVVRQYQEEFMTRVAMVMDTFVPPQKIPSFRLTKLKPPAAEASLEAGLSLASAIADYLARQEYVVDLFAAGPELYHFQAGRSLAYLENILETLACVEASAIDPFELLASRLAEELPQLSTVVVLLLHWDARRQAMIESFREHGVEVKIIVISDTLHLQDLRDAGPNTVCLTPAMVASGVTDL